MNFVELITTKSISTLVGHKFFLREIRRGKALASPVTEPQVGAVHWGWSVAFADALMRPGAPDRSEMEEEFLFYFILRGDGG